MESELKEVFQKALIDDTETWLESYSRKRKEVGVVPSLDTLKQRALKKFPELTSSLFEDNFKRNHQQLKWERKK